MRQARGRRRNVVSISSPGATAAPSRLVRAFLPLPLPPPGRDPLGTGARTLGGREAHPPRRTLRAPARGGETRGPTFQPGAGISRLFGPLALGPVIESRARGLSLPAQVASRFPPHPGRQPPPRRPGPAPRDPPAPASPSVPRRGAPSRRPGWAPGAAFQSRRSGRREGRGGRAPADAAGIFKGILFE